MKKKPKKKDQIKSKLFTTVVIIAVCVTTVLWIKSVRLTGMEIKKSLESRTKGNSGAYIRIVEYLDFQCPSCAQGYFLLKRYFEKYPARIQIELKYFPLTKKQNALEAALYAECAARQNKFWEYSDLLLKRQLLWKKLSDAEPMFRDMVIETGLDENELADCVFDKKTKESILAERDQGKKLGITRTPTYFVNDKMFVGVRNLERELNIYFK